MGLMDKVKKILFDEDEVEIPVNSEELPERTPKKPKKEEKKGFIEYHHDEDIKPVEEDTIKEVIVPKEEVLEPKNSFNFPIDLDFDTDFSRTRSHEEEEIIEPKKEIPVYKEPIKKIKPREEIDYTKYLSEKEEKVEKKPFKVTPIISPVYGILDKNYRPEDVKPKKEIKENVTIESARARMFGPVSYNDIPLPSKKTEIIKEEQTKQEDLVELNSTISELISDTIRTDDEELKTSGIENEYLGNNNIEDAFETTSEFDKINNDDKLTAPKDLEEDQVDIEAIINSDDSELDDTIETDLFNLIDSMYKSDDNKEREE